MALPRVEVIVSADTAQAEAGLERVEDGMRDVGASADKAARRADSFGGAMRRAASRTSRLQLGVQNAAFQIGDFATQVGAGTAASVALGQQLPQLLGGFGILGAVLGAVAAVSVPLFRTFQNLSESGQDLGQVLGTMQPLASALAQSFATVRDAGVQMAEIIVNNLDRIISVGIAAAALFAGRFVVAFVAARVATFSLSAALAGLRTALIRTGIGALIVGAGELVYQFSRLVKASGGLGEAWALLLTAAKDIFSRIGASFSIVPKTVGAGARMMAALFLEQLAIMLSRFSQFLNGVVTSLNETLGTSIGFVDMGNAIQGLVVASGSFAASARVMSDEVLNLQESLSAPIESIETMRDLLRSLRDERLDIPSLLTGAGEDGEGGKGKSAWDQMIENMQRVQSAQESLRSASASAWGAMGGFVQQFAGKSKAAAIAAIAIQKGLSIAQILANSAAAQLRALAELGPVAGPPMAAKIAAYGRLQAGIVAATGLVQAASAGGGGGGAPISSGGASSSASAAQETSAPTTTIQIAGGDMFSRSSLVSLINELQESGHRIRAVS